MTETLTNVGKKFQRKNKVEPLFSRVSVYNVQGIGNICYLLINILDKWQWYSIVLYRIKILYSLFFLFLIFKYQQPIHLKWFINNLLECGPDYILKFSLLFFYLSKINVCRPYELSFFIMSIFFLSVNLYVEYYHAGPMVLQWWTAKDPVMFI